MVLSLTVMVAAKMEELRVQLEKLKEEKVAIELENESLKAAQVEQDTELNEMKEQEKRMAAEMYKLKERNSAVSAELDELRGLSDDQLAEIAKLGEAVEAAESRWRAEIDKLTTESELKPYQSSLAAPPLHKRGRVWYGAVTQVVLLECN